MNVYYKNALPQAARITMPALADSSAIEDLYSPSLMTPALFSAAQADITALFGEGIYIDSLVLMKAPFSQAHLRLLFGRATVYETWIYPQGPHTLHKLPEGVFTDTLSLTVYANANVSIGYMFAGLRTELPRFVQGPDINLTVTSKADFTDSGVVYGLRRPSVQTFAAQFRELDRAMRDTFIDYIDTVQYITPHPVEAYFAEVWQPLFAVLTDGGAFKKLSKSGFYFDTSLAWKEAR